MNILLTRFIYPIQEEMVISEKLKFSLDNPRTDNEIGIIKAHLEKSLNSPDEVYEFDHQWRLPIYSTEETKGILTIESGIKDFRQNYSKEDEYLETFFNNNKESDPIELIAKMWIVARYDDEGEREALRKWSQEIEEKEGRKGGFFMLDDKNPIITNSDNLINCTYLLSLLINTDIEFYHGESFILNHNEFELQFPKLDKYLNFCVLSFGFSAYSAEMKNDEDRWKSFFHIRDRIKEVSAKLNDILDDENRDKILFIANQLKAIGHDINDEKLRLVTLVSIIELLLTHSPDFRRFNIEDSISKQFRLKASILIYQNDRSRDLNQIKDRLKEIYNQRSNIAHGNFKSLTKYIEKEIKKTGEDDVDEVIILERLNGDLFKFIRAIIEEYMKDRKFVEFLKEN